MSRIDYPAFSHAHADSLLATLNDAQLRRHLVVHDAFDATSIRAWIDGKIAADTLPGCRVRIVCIDGKTAGWCGIQRDDDGHEIAIVLSPRFWGHGIAIFKTLMHWAAELGHREVRFHLLETRREYAALRRMARTVSTSTLLGRRFTTYVFAVDAPPGPD